MSELDMFVTAAKHLRKAVQDTFWRFEWTIRIVGDNGTNVHPNGLPLCPEDTEAWPKPKALDELYDEVYRWRLTGAAIEDKERERLVQTAALAQDGEQRAMSLLKSTEALSEQRRVEISRLKEELKELHHELLTFRESKP